MRTRYAITAAVLILATAPAQTYVLLPGTANPALELPGYSLVPLMQPSSRVQAFYDAAEVGPAFVADRLELRYDGPIPQVGAPGPFSIQNLEIRIGVSAVATPTANFAANLTQPLTTVFAGPWTYLPDSGSAAPHPWGGPGGTLTFVFATAVPIAVPPGQWLVIEIAMQGNNISQFGFAHAILDGAATTGGPVDGSAVSYGTGCSAATGAPPAGATTNGFYAPGGAHSLGGSNLGASTIAVAIFGLSNASSFVPLPWTLPGTSCTLLASPDATVPTLTDASGAVSGANAVTFVLPATAAIAGLPLYEQLASLVPTANPWGLVLSDAVAITIGGYTPPGRGTWLVSHDTDASAAYADAIRAFGLAARLRTL